MGHRPINCLIACQICDVLLRNCIHSVHFVSLPAAAICLQNRGCQSVSLPALLPRPPFLSLHFPSEGNWREAETHRVCGSQPLNPAIMGLMSVLSSHSGSGRVVVLFQLKTMPLVTKSTCLHLFVSKLFWIYIVRIVLSTLMTILCVCPTIAGHALGIWSNLCVMVGHQAPQDCRIMFIALILYKAIENVPVK